MTVNSERLIRGNVKKIAIFRALYLGDMLCVIPTIRAIRQFFPEADITLVGLPWQSSFVKRFQMYFDRFIEFPGWPGLPEQTPDSTKIFKFLNHVRAERFDIIFQMQGNGRITNEMCMLWGGRYVCGLKRHDEKMADEKFFPSSEDDEHEVLRFLKLTDALDIPRAGTDLEFPISPGEVAAFENIRSELGLSDNHYICMHPGARDPGRRWRKENFAFVSRQLFDKGFPIVLTGSLAEKDLLASVQAEMSHPVINIIDRLGDVELGSLALIIKNSRMLVSNDTGVSHIAAGLKTPSVIIFSPHSGFNRWRPLNTNLHQCVRHHDANDPEGVLYTILNHLQKTAMPSHVFQ
jgi:ADP-heptose:LPS heptosyltransferase